MGIQASNTDKELKKNKFETANQSDTIQPKSIDGLQNHADTQKLIRVKTAAEQSNRNEKLTQFKTATEQSNHHKKLTQFKTAAEQSNRHEKLTQFKTAAKQSNRHEKLTQLQSMGDARAHRIQNGGVVQLMWPAAGRVAAMGAGAAARGAGGRGPLIAKVLTGLAGMQAVATLADNGSGLAFGVLMKDKKKIFEGSVGLLEPAISKMGLPDGVTESAQTYLKTLIKFSESVEYGDSTDDSAFQRIGEDFRVFTSSAVWGYDTSQALGYQNGGRNLRGLLNINNAGFDNFLLQNKNPLQSAFVTSNVATTNTILRSSVSDTDNRSQPFIDFNITGRFSRGYAELTDATGNFGMNLTFPKIVRVVPQLKIFDKNHTYTNDNIYYAIKCPRGNTTLDQVPSLWNATQTLSFTNFDSRAFVTQATRSGASYLAAGTSVQVYNKTLQNESMMCLIQTLTDTNLYIYFDDEEGKKKNNEIFYFI